MEVFLTYLAIFFAKIAHVSLGTIRIIYLTRNKSIPAGVIGFFEIIIYLIALTMVLQNLNQWQNILVYGLGYAAGNIVGSKIEEKIAIGIVHVQIVTLKNGGETVDILRDLGFGVTSFPCYGREGEHLTLNVIVNRKELPKLMKVIQEHDPAAFISVLDTRQIMGGYFKRMKAK